MGAGITEKVSRHAVNPTMGAQHRHPVGDGLAPYTVLPFVPTSGLVILKFIGKDE